MAEKLSLDRVLGLAKAGEAFILNGATVPLDDLIAIATAASSSKATIRLRGLGGRPLEELMRITVASQGRVILEDDEPPTRRAKPPMRRTWFGLRSPVPVPRADVLDIPSPAALDSIDRHGHV